MNRTICSIAFVAAAALAGCNRTDETAAVNNSADEVANAPVVLPPAIVGSHVYRCKDNSLIYVDWYNDGSARVKASRNEAGTQIPAPAPDSTEASPLVGSPSDTTITYSGKSCKR